MEKTVSKPQSVQSFFFGHYPATANGKALPVEWDILKKEDHKALLISKYVLETRRFDASSCNWELSEIRNWLNTVFLNKAFTNQEKAAMLDTVLEDVGTTDKVFLLSEDDVLDYFDSEEARVRVPFPNAYSRVHGGALIAAFRKDPIVWLRTPCNYDCPDGRHIRIVYENGRIIHSNVRHNHGGVCPAIWVNSDALALKQSTEGTEG